MIERARTLADDVFFPTANEVDAAGVVPVGNLERLVDEGLYGLVGPTSLAGAGADPVTSLAVVEAFAGACLTTCFVWLQHQGAVRAVVNAEGAVHERWASALCRGTTKAGIAFAHLLRPTVAIVAEPAGGGGGGWRFTGTAPWVTGWGYIDQLLVAGRNVADGTVVWALVDACAGPSLSATPLALSAVNASATAAVQFSQHFVAAEQVTHIEPYEAWVADYPKGLRANASLGLGVASRAASLLAETPQGAGVFDDELSAIRHRLDTAAASGDHTALPAARAELSTLTVRMTAALIAAAGGRSITTSEHGQRLAREAMFLLIQGQTPAIKAGQVASLARIE